MEARANLIRERNLRRLLVYLYRKEHALKVDMARDTGLSVVTVNALVRKLVEEKWLMEGEQVQPKLGRPATAYAFNYNHEFFALFAVKDRNGKLVVDAKIVNLKGEAEFQETFDFSRITLDNLCKIVYSVLQKNPEISKIAVSIPGKISEGQVTSSWYSKLDDWPIMKALQELSGLPVVVQNDAHVMTLGYSLLQRISIRKATIVGVFFPLQSMPGITILIDGKLMEGNHSLAGEGKYLPFLMDSGVPQTKGKQLADLAQIVEIYNAVLAPTSFILAAEKEDEQAVREFLASRPHLDLQPNTPTIYIDHDFQKSVWQGLFWLAAQYDEKLYFFE
ncbi:ROK family protein [Listeria fleischmannii]|uniref:ROK family protein n=1 Tax=Listeria fleischmannii TaxID=1069827 RepID=UPI00162ACA36|nr:ROK family protein [Listeria fleischmannii]MBC1417805.1 ROK family protein [Listeria fleischmannii]